MSDRKEKFTTFTNLDFSDLKKIQFKSGHDPRNATDYYYHAKTNTTYAYYWTEDPSDKLNWELNPSYIRTDNVAYPSELCDTILLTPGKKISKCVIL